MVVMYYETIKLSIEYSLTSLIRIKGITKTLNLKKQISVLTPHYFEMSLKCSTNCSDKSSF